MANVAVYNGKLYKVKYLMTTMVDHQDEPHSERFSKICQECDDDLPDGPGHLHTYAKIPRMWASYSGEINQHPIVWKFYDKRYKVALIIIYSIKPI